MLSNKSGGEERWPGLPLLENWLGSVQLVVSNWAFFASLLFFFFFFSLFSFSFFF